MTSNQSDECIAHLPGDGIGSLNGMMFKFFGWGEGGGGGGGGELGSLKRDLPSAPTAR